jgi:hypothetical protein
MTIPPQTPQQPEPARPLTYHRAESAYNIVTARERHEELTDRDMSARAAAQLRERGKFDPGNLGHQLVAAREPLSVTDLLELMATGEVLARYYRHPAPVDRAVKDGATWEQIGDARGQSAEQARREYRQWAEGQHSLHEDIGLGLNDTDYAEAMRYASVPTERERRAEELARVLNDPSPVPGPAKAHAATHPILCAHADQDGAGSHWLEPGQTCPGAWPPAATAAADLQAGQ